MSGDCCMSDRQRFDLYVCNKCGWVTSADPKGAIGTAHAHAERHTGLWRLPAWLFPSANPRKLDQSIDRLTVEVVEVDSA